MRQIDSTRRSIRSLTATLFLLASTGCVLAVPKPAVVGSPPKGLGAKEVEFPSPSGSVIHAWLAPGRPGIGAVLLLHGVGANRTSMMGRASFLHALGFTVM